MDLSRSIHVMSGLDPRIYLFRKMDCRVKPGNDDGLWCVRVEQSFGEGRCSGQAGRFLTRATSEVLSASVVMTIGGA
jgi:hypothetical protein